MSTLRENVARAPAQQSLFTERKHERRYLEHRRDHPEVFDKLVMLARDVKAEGWNHCSFRMLWETLRLRYGPHEKDDLGFSLNDWLAPFYSREIQRECPDLDGMFETRERAS